MKIIQFKNSVDVISIKFNSDYTIETILNKFIEAAKLPTYEFQDVKEIDFNKFREQFNDDIEILTTTTETTWLLAELDSFLRDFAIVVEVVNVID